MDGGPWAEGGDDRHRGAGCGDVVCVPAGEIAGQSAIGRQKGKAGDGLPQEPEILAAHWPAVLSECGGNQRDRLAGYLLPQSADSQRRAEHLHRYHHVGRYADCQTADRLCISHSQHLPCACRHGPGLHGAVCGHDVLQPAASGGGDALCLRFCHGGGEPGGCGGRGQNHEPGQHGRDAAHGGAGRDCDAVDHRDRCRYGEPAGGYGLQPGSLHRHHGPQRHPVQNGKQGFIKGGVSPMLMLCYPKCTTCQKAMHYLEEKGVSFEMRHIKDNNPTAEELSAWQKKSGLALRRFFNTSGLQYRALELKDKLPQMTEEEMLALLATDGMLVKRPILITEETVLVGFKPAEWEAVL